MGATARTNDASNGCGTSVAARRTIFPTGIDSVVNFFALKSLQRADSVTRHQHTAVATMKTQWKDIPAVPTSQEFLDIVLSRTQRRYVPFSTQPRKAPSLYSPALCDFAGATHIA